MEQPTINLVRGFDTDNTADNIAPATIDRHVVAPALQEDNGGKDGPPPKDRRNGVRCGQPRGH